MQILKSVQLSNEVKIQDYMEIKNQTLISYILEDPNIARSLDYADYLLTYHFGDTVHKQVHNKQMIEIFNSDFIMSKLYGLEIHKIKEYFTKFGNKIKVGGFILIIMKLIQFSLDEVVYLINGLRELGEEIAVENILTFDQFIQYYMTSTELEYERENEQAQYSVKETKNQDNFYHKHEIQKAIYCKSIQKIALMEENQAEVMLLQMDFKLFKYLKLDNEDIHYIILDFDYSEKNKEFCCTLSCNLLLFFSMIDQLHTKKQVQCDHLFTKVQYLNLLNQWASITTTQSVILWTYKGDQQFEQFKVQLNLSGGKIQNIIEIEKNEFICFQTDMKRIHLFNTKFEQLLIIQDTLLIQTFLYHNFGQCFYSSNYTHKIQKWFIEENGIDYTKDKVIEICKPEYAILAIGFVSNLVVTYDSSTQIRVFDPEDFKKITAYKKLLKPTNRMKLIEISPLHFIIVGTRISSFQIEIKKDDTVPLKPEQQAQLIKDYEAKLLSTKKLLQTIIRSQPKIQKFRGTKHQDQIESILEQIQGAKNQFLPKIKKKDKNQYVPIDEEYMREKIEEIDRNSYTMRLMSDRLNKEVESQKDQNQPNYLQQLSYNGRMKIESLSQKLNRVESQRVHSEQTSIIPNIKQRTNKSKFKKDLESTKNDTNFINSHKNTQSIFNTQLLLTNQDDDYLNYLQKKKGKNNLHCETRHQYQSQRRKVKKSLFLSLSKPRDVPFRVNIPTIHPASEVELPIFNSPPRVDRKKSIKQEQICTDPIPDECQQQWRTAQYYLNQAMNAMEYLEKQKPYILS